MTPPEATTRAVVQDSPVTITALPRSVSLVLYAGDDFTFDLVITDNSTGGPYPLDGATADAQIRVKATEPDPPLASFVTSITANTITLRLDGATTAGLPGKAAWDCQLTEADGTVTTLAGGSISVKNEVTRAAAP